MRSIKPITLLAAAAGTLATVLFASPALAEPLGTAFTYQGELRSLPANTVVTGTATVKFRLYDAVTGGTRLGMNGAPNATFELVRTNVVLTDGKFTVSDLDFGTAFDANAKYLEILVTLPGQAEVTLSPRQRIGTGPAASFASNAASASTAGNATNLGGVASATYSRLDTAQTFSGAKTFAVPPAFSSLSGAPFTVQSTATVANLSADFLDGYHAAAFGRLAAAQTWTQVNTFSQNILAQARLGIGTATPGFPLAVFGTDQQMLDVNSNHVGGTWLNIVNRATGGKSWSFIAAGPGNGEGAGNLAFRNNTDNYTPYTFLANGTMGIGTITPGDGMLPGQQFEKLEVAGPDVGVRIRNTNDPIGGILWNSFGTLHMGMYNPTAAAVAQIPANMRRAFFSVSSDGRVGSTTNTGGSPTYRNYLDDGSGNFIVRAPGSISGNHVALFENTSGTSGDGIAIKIDQAHTNRDNNFVTFYNGAGAVTGRIEGFDLENGDWVVPPPTLNTPVFNVDSGITSRPVSQWFSPGTPPSHTWDPGRRPSLTPNTATVAGVTVVTGFNWDSGVSPSMTFNSGTLPLITGSPVNFGTPSFTVTNLPTPAQLNDLYCWYNTNGMASILTFDPVGLATRNAWITAAQLCRDEGVTYGSKGADYAEWLPRADESEDIRWGMVVGVKGGMISKTTDGADQVMVVSRAPIVLGNTPPAGQEARYEKVGFMGQVHTLVRGIVCVGDYILPSGLSDGSAIAIAPDKIAPAQLGKVIGRAWSASTGPMDFVNVAVGMNGGEVASVVGRQQARVEALATENASLRTDVEALKAQCAAMQEAIRALQPDAVPARRATPLHVR